MGSDRKTTFQRVVAELATAFESAKRDSGDTYYRRRDDAPAWIDTDLMLEIHNALDDGDPRFPSDWVYAETRAIAGDLAEREPQSARDLDDARHEIADSRVDVYNADRLAWLADHAKNAAIVDDAVREGLVSADADTCDRIGSGQYLAATRMIDAIIGACEREASDRDDAIANGTRCPDDLADHPSAVAAMFGFACLFA